MLHLKTPELEPEESGRQVRASVEAMLDDIARRGENLLISGFSGDPRLRGDDPR